MRPHIYSLDEGRRGKEMSLTQQSIAIIQANIGVERDGLWGPKSAKAALDAGLSLMDQRVPGAKTFGDAVGIEIDDATGNPAWSELVSAIGSPGAPWGLRGVPGPFTPVGVVLHHTGFGGERERCNEGLIAEGRSDLKGPLYNFVVNQNLSVSHITNGRTHHAGMGFAGTLDVVRSGSLRGAAEISNGARTFRKGPDTISGNTYYLSISIDGRPSTPQYGAMLAVAEKIARAMLQHMGPKATVISHAEHTKRKTDVEADMGALRVRVHASEPQATGSVEEKTDLYVYIDGTEHPVWRRV